METPKEHTTADEIEPSVPVPMRMLKPSEVALLLGVTERMARMIRRVVEVAALLVLLAWLAVVGYLSCQRTDPAEELEWSETIIEEVLADPANREAIEEARREAGESRADP